MKRQLRALLALMLTLGLSLTLGGSAFAIVLEPEVISEPFGGYIVKLRAPESEVMTLSAAPDCLVPILPDMGYYRVDTKEDAAALIADGQVEMMEPDYQAELFDVPAEPAAPSALAEPVPSKIPNDPAYSKNLQKDLDLIGMNYAWEHDLTGAGVTVAVIDSGYTPLHEDAPAKVLPGKYFYYVKDPNGKIELNGLTGKYTLKEEADTKEQIVTKDDYARGHGHGTRVSGVIAAGTNNGKGMIGVAPQVNLLPVRCFTGTEGHVGGYTSNLVKGIEYAVEQKADIINMSWGIRANTKMLADVVRLTQAAGILMVAAVGNDGGNAAGSAKPPDMLIYPACYPQVIGVGATKDNGDMAYFSQKNKTALVSAPGENIYTPNYGTVNEYSNVYGSTSGTSFSAPMVAAVLALALADDPTLTAEQCKLILEGTAIPLRADAKDREFGGSGLVNVETMITRKGRVVTSAHYQKTTAKEGAETATLEVDAFLGDRQLTTTHTALMVRYDALGYLAETQNLPITAVGGLSHVSFPIAVQEPGTTYQVFFLDPVSLGVSLPSATCAVPATPVVAE